MKPHWHNVDGEAVCEEHAPRADTSELEDELSRACDERDAGTKEERSSVQRRITELRQQIRAKKNEVEEGDLNSNETDSPENCVVCGRLLEYTLTPDGVRYVLDAILDALDEGPEAWNKVSENGPAYYKGSRHVEIVRDWAKDLKWYNLSRVDKFVIDHFLELTAETDDGRKQRTRKTPEQARAGAGESRKDAATRHQ